MHSFAVWWACMYTYYQHITLYAVLNNTSFISLGARSVFLNIANIKGTIVFLLCVVSVVVLNTDTSMFLIVVHVAVLEHFNCVCFGFYCTLDCSTTWFKGFSPSSWSWSRSWSWSWSWSSSSSSSSS